MRDPAVSPISKSVRKIRALNSIEIEKNLVHRFFNQTLVYNKIAYQEVLKYQISFLLFKVSSDL